MSDRTCCGYTNWDTFIVVMYSDNYSVINSQKLSFFDNLIDTGVLVVPTNAAQEFAERSGLIALCQKVDGDNFEIGEVDWIDIAETWTTEMNERDECYTG